SSPWSTFSVSSMRMLEAFTGPPTAVSIVTATGCSLADWEKIAAGRAWRPLVLATFTVRAGIGTPFSTWDDPQRNAAHPPTVTRPWFGRCSPAVLVTREKPYRRPESARSGLLTRLS